MYNDERNYIYSVERNSHNQIYSVDFHNPWSQMELQSRNSSFSQVISSQYPDDIRKGPKYFWKYSRLVFYKKGRIFHIHFLNLNADYMTWLVYGSVMTVVFFTCLIEQFQLQNRMKRHFYTLLMVLIFSTVAFQKAKES